MGLFATTLSNSAALDKLAACRIELHRLLSLNNGETGQKGQKRTKASAGVGVRTALSPAESNRHERHARTCTNDVRSLVSFLKSKEIRPGGWSRALIAVAEGMLQCFDFEEFLGPLFGSLLRTGLFSSPPSSMASVPASSGPSRSLFYHKRALDLEKVRSDLDSRAGLDSISDDDAEANFDNIFVSAKSKGKGSKKRSPAPVASKAARSTSFAGDDDDVDIMDAPARKRSKVTISVDLDDDSAEAPHLPTSTASRAPRLARSASSYLDYLTPKDVAASDYSRGSDSAALAYARCSFFFPFLESTLR